MKSIQNIQDKVLTVLGSTGSIGTQTLDVAETHGIPVEALSARENDVLLADQIQKFRPKYAAMTDPAAAKRLKERILDTDVRLFVGMDGLLEMLTHLSGDTVLNAIIGGDGLLPTLTAIEQGKNIALANKETLVTAGEYVMNRVREKGVTLMPVDSEHCAIFQCLQAGRREEVRRLILTASGGPFFGKKRQELLHITPEQALNHPTWQMGRKITIDSATLMNKCFEMIEAAFLFGVSADQIDVVVHRQSVVHSMVEFADGAVIAQLATPDMRMCIQYAVSYPERLPGRVKPMDFTTSFGLTFDPPDPVTFKPLALAKYVLSQGGVLPAVLNGVNDEAVKLFLEKKIGFLDIGDFADEIVRTYENILSPTPDQILEAEREAGKRVRMMAGVGE